MIGHLRWRDLTFCLLFVAAAAGRRAQEIATTTHPGARPQSYCSWVGFTGASEAASALAPAR